MLLTTQPLLVPRSWKSRAKPLPTLWATTGSVMGTLNIPLWFVCVSANMDKPEDASPLERYVVSAGKLIRTFRRNPVLQY